jgi:hypothetical protein
MLIDGKEFDEYLENLKKELVEVDQRVSNQEKQISIAKTNLIELKANRDKVLGAAQAMQGIKDKCDKEQESEQEVEVQSRQQKRAAERKAKKDSE